MKDKKTHHLLHLIIAGAAVFNLICLFLFQYGLSDATPAVLAAQRASEERAAATPQITAEDEGEDVAVSEEDVSSDTESSDESSADGTESADSTGETEASGIPSITLSEPLPTIDMGDLPNLARVLADLGCLSADDGYGNNITDQIIADYEEISADSLEYRATFSVTNRAGATAEATCTITTQAGTKPLLELTDDTITLAVGDSFNFMRYVKTARDIDGASLDTRISISGVVDTSTRGTYELEYSTLSRITQEKVSKALTIIVQ